MALFCICLLQNSLNYNLIIIQHYLFHFAIYYYNQYFECNWIRTWSCIICKHTSGVQRGQWLPMMLCRWGTKTSSKFFRPYGSQCHRKGWQSYENIATMTFFYWLSAVRFTGGGVKMSQFALGDMKPHYNTETNISDSLPIRSSISIMKILNRLNPRIDSCVISLGVRRYSEEMLIIFSVCTLHQLSFNPLVPGELNYRCVVYEGLCQTSP